MLWLVGWLAVSAVAQVDPDRLEALLDRVNAALNEDEFLSPDALLQAYRQVLLAWAEQPELVEDDFDLLLEDLHGLRVQLAQELGRDKGFEFAHEDWQCVLKLGASRTQDAIDLIETVVPLYERNPYVPLLLCDLAQFRLFQGRFDESSKCLEEARGHLDELEASKGDLVPPRRVELTRAWVQYDLLRASEFLRRGQTEFAAEPIRQALQRAGSLLREHNQHGQFMDALRLQLTYWLETGDVERVLRRVQEEEVQQLLNSPSTDALARHQILLRQAVAKVQEERLNPQATREAEGLLQELREATASGAGPVDRDDERRLVAVHTCIQLVDAASRGEKSVEEVQEAIEWAQGLWEGQDSATGITLHALSSRMLRISGADRQPLESKLAVLSEGVNGLLDEWRRQKVQETGQGFLVYEQITECILENMSLLLAIHGRQEGSERAFQLLLELQSVGSLARSLSAGPGSLAQVQRKLAAPSQGLICFLSGWHRSLCFLVDDRQVRCLELDGIHILERARDNLRVAAMDALFEPTASNSALLDQRREEAARVFLTPEVKKVVSGWTALTVVAVDATGFVPVELLPWQDATLGARLAVSYLPSFPVGLELAERSRQSPLAPEEVKATLLAYFAEDGSELLQFEDVERELLLGNWPFANPDLRVGSAASLKELANPLLKQRHILQLIGHGVQDFAQDRPYGLRLADEVLFPANAEALLQVPEMVVVTACQTWRGPLRRGDDGRNHLGGALFLCGANTLVMSYTQVDFHSTLRLMDAFYAELGQGHSPAEALRRARTSPNARPGDEIHPLHSSLIHVIGLGNRAVTRPVEESLAPVGLWIGAGIVALLAAGVLVRRRAG